MRAAGPHIRCHALLSVALAGVVIAAGACGTDSNRKASPPPADASASSPSKTSPKGDGGGPVENPAPDFRVETFDGETFALAEQRGTPVVLNFWESW